MTIYNGSRVFINVSLRPLPHKISAMACLKDGASDRQAALMIIVVMMVRVFAACVHRETACSLEIKTRSEDNCMTEFMKVEFINGNDKKNWHLRVQIILYRHLRS